MNTKGRMSKILLVGALTITVAMTMLLAGCGQKAEGEITIAAAASLQKVIEEELIPAFNEEYPEVEVKATFDSSGKLQTQIQEGADVDIFFSAAEKQMNELKEKKMIEEESIQKVLVNEIVLIESVNKKDSQLKTFKDIVKAETIALGEPEMVPAGQYAQEALTTLGLWDQVNGKTISWGTNVTEVLNWVAEGSADTGIVYESDAFTLRDKVKIIGAAPGKSHRDCIYPIGITSASKNKDVAQKLIEFFLEDEAQKVFEKYGFQSGTEK